MKVDSGSGTVDTVRVTNALAKFKTWQDSLLKEVSYNVSCWKLPADNAKTVANAGSTAYTGTAAGTDMHGDATTKCVTCAKAGETPGADKCVNDYYPLMQDATSGAQ
jgi:hypothetical protein